MIYLIYLPNRNPMLYLPNRNTHTKMNFDFLNLHIRWDPQCVAVNSWSSYSCTMAWILWCCSLYASLQYTADDTFCGSISFLNCQYFCVHKINVFQGPLFHIYKINVLEGSLTNWIANGRGNQGHNGRKHPWREATGGKCNRTQATEVGSSQFSGGTIVRSKGSFWPPKKATLGICMDICPSL